MNHRFSALVSHTGARLLFALDSVLLSGSLGVGCNSGVNRGGFYKRLQRKGKRISAREFLRSRVLDVRGISVKQFPHVRARPGRGDRIFFSRSNTSVSGRTIPRRSD